VRVEDPVSTSLGRARDAAPSVGIVSTYPPTPCGLATFSAALADGLAALGSEVGVVRVADGSSRHLPRVIGDLQSGSPSSVAAAAAMLDDHDVVVVQHEYGLYGGTDGDEVLALLDDLRVPSVVVAHTVLRHPTPHQRSVLVAVADAADRVVVMSEAAKRLLCGWPDVDPDKVLAIPHGAAIPAGAPDPPAGTRPLLVTPGLMGPGKGIERMIDAMGPLRRLPQRPRYLVAGRTHPKVLAADGEQYRNTLIEMAWRNGVATSVAFDATYRDVPALTALLRSATVVVLPYDSTEQVTSGVLVDAIAAGCPVVATAFPHAVELLGDGAGLVVGHDDPDALVRALHRVVSDPVATEAMADHARRLAPTMGWPVVARRYQDLAASLLVERPVPA
jgi:polysaccharide biosynthesis protein PslF